MIETSPGLFDGNSSFSLSEDSEKICRPVVDDKRDRRAGLIRMPSKKSKRGRRKTQKKKQKTNRASSKAKRGVHFNLDPTSDKVMEEVRLFEKASVKQHEHLYWSNKEKAAIQFLAKCEGEAFLFEEEDLVELLDKAFLSCGRDDIPPLDDIVNEETMLSWASDYDIRGLEDVVSAEFQEHRSLATAMILDYQNYLRETLGPKADCDELLRKYSEKISLRSREFAAKMGDADCFAANDTY